MKAKRCSQCGLVKVISAFHRVKAGEEKRVAQCKMCDAARRTASYRACSVRLGKTPRTLTLVARELRAKGLKRCPGCKLDKTTKSFYANKAANDGLASHCILCTREIAKNNPAVQYTPEQKRVARHKHLLRRFGISLVDYDILLSEQNGLCAICGDKDKEKTLAVDHDHSTGKIRGLLCGSCNPAIGFLKDDPDRAIKAAAYLKKHKE